MLPAFLWMLQVVSKRKGGPQALIVSTLYVRLSPIRVVGMKRKLAHCGFAIYKDRYSNKSGIHFSWLSKRPLNSDSSPPKVLSGLPVRGQFSQVCLGTHGMSFYWKSQLFYGHQSLPKDLSRGLPANSLRAVCTQNMTSRVKSILSPWCGVLLPPVTLSHIQLRNTCCVCKQHFWGQTCFNIEGSYDFFLCKYGSVSGSPI